MDIFPSIVDLVGYDKPINSWEEVFSQIPENHFQFTFLEQFIILLLKSTF